MKVIKHIIQKEFKQIFRNKAMLHIIFILPVLQLVILSNAATYEIDDIRIGIIDHDDGPLSESLIKKFNASTYFTDPVHLSTQRQADKAILNDRLGAILEIPEDFEKNLILKRPTKLSLRINAIDGASAGVKNTYINKVVQAFNTDIKTERSAGKGEMQGVDVIPLFWYNQSLNYKLLMVPGILVLIVTMLTLFLSGMNIVREKEIGTLEQINVTPIGKWQFIIGKLLPFWIIGLFLLTIGLLIAQLIFQIPVVGSIALIYLYASLYLILVLGMGLFISNFTDTQQQAMFIAWFFVVIFILMSGLFTPIESMPNWAQSATELNPVKYFVEFMRLVMLKGSSFEDTFHIWIKTFAFALIMNIMAVISYKKTS